MNKRIFNCSIFHHQFVQFILQRDAILISVPFILSITGTKYKLGIFCFSGHFFCDIIHWIFLASPFVLNPTFNHHQILSAFSLKYIQNQLYLLLPGPLSNILTGCSASYLLTAVFSSVSATNVQNSHFQEDFLLKRLNFYPIPNAENIKRTCGKKPVSH